LKYIDGYMDVVLKEQINTQYKMHGSQRKAVTRRHEHDLKYKVNTWFLRHLEYK